MTHSDLISVVIAYHNCHLYIEQALKSLVWQTHPNIEVIVVNDGSDDADSAYLEALLKNFNDIIYKKQENHGLSHARNQGAYAATGDYLVFLDADDKLHPNYLEKTLAHLKNHPEYKIVYTKARYFEASTKPWELKPCHDIKDLLMGNQIYCSALHRRQDFLAIQGFDESLASHEDWDYWLRLLGDGKIGWIDEELFFYRKRLDQSSLSDALAQDLSANAQSWQAVYRKNEALFLHHGFGFWSLTQKITTLNEQLNQQSKDNLVLRQENTQLQLLKKQLDVQLGHEKQKQNIQENLQIAHQALQDAHHDLLEKNRKQKRLLSFRVVKPFLNTERALHSLNDYRKGFRKLYQKHGVLPAYHLTKDKYRTHGYKQTKAYLKQQLKPKSATLTSQSQTPTSFWVGDRISYQKWIAQNEHLDIQACMDAIDGFAYQPLINILMPVYKSNLDYLRQAIDSVLAQIYPNWQLCISDDASNEPKLLALLQEYSKDSRIQVVIRKENGHISQNSNSALALCQGEWTALMDHDDLLPPHSLFEVVKALQARPDAMLVYSDEDKIDAHNLRFLPHFKPDFNLNLLYSQNYISHLGVYKTHLAKSIGGFRVGFEGSQDYDFLLRYLSKIPKDTIIHIPKILYHWRAIEGSTALNADEKSYTTQAGLKALREYFKNLQQNVTVSQGVGANLYRVQWHWQQIPLVSLIVPTYNAYALTKQLIDSILQKTTYPNYEIILVNNCSDDPRALAYFDNLKTNPHIQVLDYPHPFNYSAINNFAVAHAKGSLIGLINNDIEVINSDWLDEMVGHALRPDVGCVGAKLYYPDDTIQHAGVIVGINGVAAHSHKHAQKEDFGYFSRLVVSQNFMAVTAACLVVKKSIFDEVGGLNQTHLTIAFNDVDFCLKVAKAGYRNVWTPYAKLYHHESVSRGTEDSPEKIQRFNQEIAYMIQNWHTNVYHDPCYNPNLSFDSENFGIAFVSRVTNHNHTPNNPEHAL